MIIPQKDRIEYKKQLFQKKIVIKVYKKFKFVNIAKKKI